MIRIRLGARKLVREPDRDHPYLHDRWLVGWEPGFSAEQTADAAAGWWRLGADAERERFVVVVAEDKVRQVLEATEWLLDETDGRRAFRYRIVEPGTPLHDRYVDGPDPVPTGSRNPVAYFPDPEADLSPCACGCGTPAQGHWAPGHDVRALYRMVTAYSNGSVLDFISWCAENGRPLPAPDESPVEAAR